jgi:hypothetical protein
MLDHLETLDTAAQGLDEARARIEATRAALRAALDGGEELRQLVARLDRMAAELGRIEEKIGAPVTEASG